MRRLICAALLIFVGSACQEAIEPVDSGGGVDDLPYAREVVSFTPGEGAGFGSANFPDIVLGPPKGRGVASGSLDVLSLGAGGEIVLGFGDKEIIDGEGIDFIVFENAFWDGANPDEVYAELGVVSVSLDGEEWHEFPCEYSPEDPPPYPGCAGWSPVERFNAEDLEVLDIEITGGDGFDLADIGLERARYIKIRDLWGLGDAPSRGFDLDALGLVNFDRP